MTPTRRWPRRASSAARPSWARWTCPTDRASRSCAIPAARSSASPRARWTTSAGHAVLPVLPLRAGRREVGGDRHADGGEDAVGADRLLDAVAAKTLAHGVLELGEGQLDAGRLQLLAERAKHLAAGHVDVRHGLGGDHDPPHPARPRQ